ncbi:hypothetical protein RRG08_014785 [Elysia crispata]|uniref:Secreted protein n=1 Tax=Elysia crispata TaxID=231223 RepID=A0AAE1AVD8_9GAST|nr:hypothetical protein RRG08_014785 [Elysia crispata]
MQRQYQQDALAGFLDRSWTRHSGHLQKFLLLSLLTFATRPCGVSSGNMQHDGRPATQSTHEVPTQPYRPIGQREEKKKKPREKNTELQVQSTQQSVHAQYTNTHSLPDTHIAEQHTCLYYTPPLTRAAVATLVT